MELFWRRKSVPARPMQLAPKLFDPLETFCENFPVAGTIALDRCPVCDSLEIGRLWQLPQSRLGATTHLNSPGSPFHGFYLDYLPMLTVPQQVFVFDMCRFCHSIFRNPKDDDQGAYARDTSKVASFKAVGRRLLPASPRSARSTFPATLGSSSMPRVGRGRRSSCFGSATRNSS